MAEAKKKKLDLKRRSMPKQMLNVCNVSSPEGAVLRLIAYFVLRVRSVIVLSGTARDVAIFPLDRSKS